MSKVHRFIAALVLFLCAAIASLATAFASPYMSVEPTSTGETVSVSEDEAAFVDLASSYLYWTSGYLTFSSAAEYNAQFGVLADRICPHGTHFVRLPRGIQAK